jgi:hypothetical protein
MLAGDISLSTYPKYSIMTPLWDAYYVYSPTKLVQ